MHEKTSNREGIVRMKIIKRDGSEVTFDITKIANAIKAASDESPESERLTPRQIDYAAHNVACLLYTSPP